MEYRILEDEDLQVLFSRKMKRISAFLQRCEISKIDRRADVDLVHLDCGALRFVVKSFRSTPASTAQELAENEYKALLDIYEIDADCRMAPRPYAILLEYGLLVMEYVAGPTLMTYLLDWRAPKAQKLKRVRQAGAWLAKLHAHFATGNELIAFDQFLNSLDLAAFDQHSNVECAEAAKLLKAGTSVLSGIAFPVSRIHGDFKTGNLILSGDDVISIDTTLRHRNSGLRDAAYFLNDMALALHHPSGLWFSRAYDDLRKAFLTGLGHEGSEEARLALEWFRLASFITMWARSRRAGNSRLKALHAELVFRHLTRRSCADLGALLGK